MACFQGCLPCFGSGGGKAKSAASQPLSNGAQEQVVEDMTPPPTPPPDQSVNYEAVASKPVQENTDAKTSMPMPKRRPSFKDMMADAKEGDDMKYTKIGKPIPPPKNDVDQDRYTITGMAIPKRKISGDNMTRDRTNSKDGQDAKAKPTERSRTYSNESGASNNSGKRPSFTELVQQGVPIENSKYAIQQQESKKSNTSNGSSNGAGQPGGEKKRRPSFTELMQASTEQDTGKYTAIGKPIAPSKSSEAKTTYSITGMVMGKGKKKT